VFLVALFLEALLFQFGGITTLGVNTVTMAAPAVICYALFGRSIRRCRSENGRFLLGVGASTTALLLSFMLWAATLVLSGKSFILVVELALLPHLVLVGAEGVLTGFVVAFLARVYPGIFALPPAMATGGAE
jgi:cobalt/nickel transport system permease protein